MKPASADQIIFRLMPEASVRRDSLITGEIDIAPNNFVHAVRQLGVSFTPEG